MRFDVLKPAFGLNLNFSILRDWIPVADRPEKAHGIEPVQPATAASASRVAGDFQTMGGGGGMGGGGQTPPPPPPAGNQGTAGNDNLTGTANADTISGLDGNDTISGLAGNDTLNGDAGHDTLIGGVDSDILNGGAGDDRLFSELASIPGSVTPDLDRGTSVDSLFGGDGSDTIYAGYGDNVDGGADEDRLYISFQGATSGITFDGHLASQTIGGGTITGIEDVDWIEGSNFDDYIDAGTDYYTGYAGLSQIFGMGGNDTLIAGYYTVVLDGGDGDDFLEGRTSGYLQHINGDAGNDTIYVDANSIAIADGGDGDDRITAGGEIHGGNGNDVINLIFSYYGGTVDGDAGDDVITGAQNDNILSGGIGGDTLFGGAGADVMDGGLDDDLLSGDFGSDTLSGGVGNDTFLFGQGDGQDTITDFSHGDLVRISGYGGAESITQVGSDVVVTLSGSERITFENADLATVQAGLLFESSTDDMVVGSPGDDTLRGYGGNDTIVGAAGNDIIAGGNGADSLSGGSGDDILYGGIISPPYSFPYYGMAYTPPLMDTSGDADTILGGDGDDVVFAGYGDNVDGGANEAYGDKLFISFQAAPTGITFDARLATQTIGGGTITGIETISWVQGSNFNDYINAGAEYSYSDRTVVEGMGGNDTLIAGYYTAVLDGGDGNDFVDGRSSQYLQEVIGGAGDDTLYATPGPGTSASGGDGNDTIYAGGKISGGNGNDVINIVNSSYDDLASGDAGDDVINGSSGDNRITGGIGNDTLTGGGGNDIFLYEIGDGMDRITDFSAGDKVQLQGYDSIQSITQVGSDVVLVLSTGDRITFSSTNVATVQAGVQFAPPTDDTIYGTSRDDLLKGYGGNDTIAGRAGADTIDGGAGNDALYSDSEFEFGDFGAEHDIVNGGTGDDLIFVGYGDDADGGSGTDTLRLNLAGAVQGVTLDTTSIIAGTANIGGGTIRNVEQLGSIYGSDYDDHLTVGTQATWINVEGAGGDDTITVNGNVNTTVDGGDGADRINVLNGTVSAYGGEGADIISVSGGLAVAMGGMGDDAFFSNGGGYQFWGEEGVDTIRYILSGIAVSVDLGVVGQPNGDSLIFIENVAGSNYGDQLTGDDIANRLEGLDGDDTLSGAGGADFVDGGVGNDTISGGTGYDKLLGGSGNDTFLYALGDGSDIIADFASGDIVKVSGYGSTQSIAQQGGDVLVTFASGDQILFQNTTIATVQAGLQFDTQPPKNLVGTSGNDVLTGGSGDDKLSGLAGNDTLNGGAGKDAMTGGTGNDTYYVDSSGDTVTEAAAGGTDTVRSTINYTLGANVENGVLDGSSAINLTGNTLVNTLTGNEGANVLSGLGGADKLIGGGGNDRLDGGIGNDTLTGGTGRDTFVFSGRPGSDKITDFVSGQDFIDLSAYHISMSAVKASYRNGMTTLSIDTNHDGRTDFTITLTGSAPPVASDFVF